MAHFPAGLTDTEIDNIYDLTVGMFVAAPGATYAHDLSILVEAGLTFPQIAHALAETVTFQSQSNAYSTNPPSQNPQQNAAFTAEFLNNLLDPGISAGGRAFAESFVLDRLNHGQSRGTTMWDALVALDAVSHTDAVFGASSTLFDNRKLVAIDFTENLGVTSTDIDVLQGALEGVTTDPASVTGKEESNANSSLEHTFALTDRIDAPGINENQPGSGIDTAGTLGNDLYIGDDETWNDGDILDGNGGFDTFKAFMDDDTNSLNSTQVELFAVAAAENTDNSVDMENAFGVTTVRFANSGDPDDTTTLDLDRIQNKVKIELHDLDTVEFEVGFDNNLIAVPPNPFSLDGVDDAALDVEVSDALNVLFTIETLGDDEVGTLNFDVVEGDINWITLFEDGGNFDPEILNFSGDSFLLLTADEFGAGSNGELNDLVIADASENTGGIYLDARGNDEDLTFTGGEGDDSVGFDFGEFDGGDDVVDGGGGSNLLVMEISDASEVDGAVDDGTITNFSDLLLFGSVNGNETLEDVDDLFLVVTLAADFNHFELDRADDVNVFIVGDDLTDPFGNTSGGVQTVGGVLDWDDTSDVVLTIGLNTGDPGFENGPRDYYEKTGEATGTRVRELGDYSIWLNQIDITAVDNIDLTTNLDLTIDIVENNFSTFDTLTVRGEGYLQINSDTGVDNDYDGVTFNFTGSDLTGGFSNAGVGASGSQTFIVGDLGEIPWSDLTSFAFGKGADYDGDGDASPAENQSIINLNEGNPFDDPTGNEDDARDIVFITGTGFGNLTIVNFDDENNIVTGDLLDFSDLDISLSDLDFEALGDVSENSSSVPGLLITSDEFDGQILLVGQEIAEFNQGSLVF